MKDLENFPNLEWSLEKNNNLKSQIYEVHGKNKRYLRYLDNLVKELREGSCEGIQEKIRDAGNISKFNSIVAEIEIAKILILSGKRVRLLPDSYMNGKSPDLLVTDDKRDSYVEVKLLTEDEGDVKIVQYLREFLKGRPFRIDVIKKENISLPAIDYMEREKKEEIIQKSLQQFEVKFQTLNLKHLPTEIDTDGAVFSIYGTLGKGYPGIIRSAAFTVPEDRLQARIERDLGDKAQKRDDWKGEDLTKPYIVALFCEEWTIDDVLIKRILFGNRVTISVPPISDEKDRKKQGKARKREWGRIIENKETSIPKWKEIEKAKENGWEKLLLNEALIPNDWTYLSEPGLYLCSKVMRNVSGVLVGYTDGDCEFIPNPFATEEINDPDLAEYI